MKARSRRVYLAVATLAVFFLPAAAHAQRPHSAAERLAETYAPVTMLREQTDPPCDTAEEQYQPTGVDSVLGNPSVTLTRFLPSKGLDDVSVRSSRNE